MDKDLLENLVKQGLSSYNIAEKLGYSQTNIRYWLKKFGLKTIHKRGISSVTAKILNKKRNFKSLTDYNWTEIQAFAEENHTWREISEKFNVGMNMLVEAKEAGLFKGRSEDQIRRPRKARPRHTPESKLKLSIAQNAHLKKTGKNPWHRKNKFKSFPCEALKNMLREKQIEFVEEYKVLEDRFFEIDIAFPALKLGIEINGGQHYDTNSNLKEYYQKRHDLIVAQGWELWEINYNKLKKSWHFEDLIKLIEKKVVPATEVESARPYGQ